MTCTPKGAHRTFTNSEDARRAFANAINSDPMDRVTLEQMFGDVWDTDEMRVDFDVIGFLAPFCVVRRKSDGVHGLLVFQHHPRFYFDFTANWTAGVNFPEDA